FFFSSRRRHTRFSRDWSSDVCSSDLRQDQALEQVRATVRSASLAAESAYLQLTASLQQVRALEQALQSIRTNERSTQRGVELGRSEERRVGKGGRARGAPDPEKKNKC